METWGRRYRDNLYYYDSLISAFKKELSTGKKVEPPKRFEDSNGYSNSPYKKYFVKKSILRKIIGQPDISCRSTKRNVNNSPATKPIIKRPSVPKTNPTTYITPNIEIRNYNVENHPKQEKIIVIQKVEDSIQLWEEKKDTIIRNIKSTSNRGIKYPTKQNKAELAVLNLELEQIEKEIKRLQSVRNKQ